MNWNLFYAFILGAVAGLGIGYLLGHKVAEYSYFELEEDYKKMAIENSRIKKTLTEKTYIEHDISNCHEMAKTKLPEPDCDDESIFFIDRPTYEGDDDAQEFYLDKVDVLYSLSTKKMFENFVNDSMSDDLIRLDYENKKLCNFLEQESSQVIIAETRAEDYIYVRDLLIGIDYRIKIERGDDKSGES